MRNKLVEILIRLLRINPSDFPKETLTKESYDGMLSQMWQLPAFRKYVADRDAKLLWTLAGGEGLEAEPRDKYVMHTGQRVENLILASEAKKAYNRLQVQHKKVELTTEKK